MVIISGYFCGLLVGVVLSALIARNRGYSLWLYGALGLFLNLGAVPLTVLLTHERLQAEPNPLPGLTPFEARTVVPIESEDLAAWRVYYLGMRQGLSLATIATMAGLVMLAGLATTYILPTFVTLFEGMSLALPLPTQIVIASSKLLQSPLGVGGLWIADLALPVLTFVVMVFGGYWLPILGNVWRHSDRLWALYAGASANLESLPWEVKRRLGADVLGALSRNPPTEVAQQIQRERDRLGGALWTAMLLALPLIASFLLLCLLVALSIFMPLYQLIGSLS